MAMLKKPSIILLLSLLFFNCGSVQHKDFNLKPHKSYPRWLSSGNFNADQASGITFLKETPDGEKYFLLADDTGGILRLRISKDTAFSIQPIVFAQKFEAYIDTFPKADFEEIVYNKKSNEVYLSIEGNGNNPEWYAGIYKIFFKDDNVFSDTLNDISRIKITPETEFKHYIKDNIGYEGFTVDDNYMYLGLEGFKQGNIFADSTVLFIADKISNKIIKQINTKPLGIHTICGLYSDKNYSVFGVDRNNKTFFHILFDKNLKIIDTELTKIITSIPAYPEFDYVVSIESVTMDLQKNVYFVDDPWKTFFIPSKDILNQLDSLTVNRFRNYVPVIFKYSLSK
jgi:hypothetical protein